MEAKYYVAVRPRTNDTHPIHKEDCPFLADDEMRIYLGMFKSDNEALNEGRHHFTNSTRCPFCAKDRETVKDNSSHYMTNNTIRIAEKILVPVFMNSMFCCVN
jgi:hypothetical protein